MIGQDDEAVGPRRFLGDPLQQADDPVDAVQGIQRLAPFGTRVVGDLVVVDEVGVDHRDAAEHSLHDQAARHLADVGEEFFFRRVRGLRER